MPLMTQFGAASARAFGGLAVASPASDPYWNNVVLLLHGEGPVGGNNNVFRDNGPSNYPLTRKGAVGQGAASPYASGGGSGSFNPTGGATDWLEMTNAASLSWGTGAFTVEAWVYRTAAASTMSVVVISPSVASLNIGASGVVTFGGGGTAPGSVPQNAWTHIAVTRLAGTLTIWINGVSALTEANSLTLNGTKFAIGNDVGGGGGAPYRGLISDVRICAGVALYTAPFAVPTAPLGPVAGTQFLCNFDNAAIIDSARKGDAAHSANVSISATQVKYGASSLAQAAAGTEGIYLTNTNGLYAVGAGDFTFEAWVYMTAVPTYGLIWESRPDGVSGLYPVLYAGTGVTWFVNTAPAITGPALTLNQWYHVAVCRVAGSTRMFLNGAQVGSTYADANNYLCGPKMAIGGVNVVGNGDAFRGFLDDVRLTKGVGRYPANFTPPAAQLPDGPT